MQLPEGINDKLGGLSKTLSMTYHSTDDPETVMARMECTEANAQPWGCLSGGATLALAENLAGVGSMCLMPGRVILGINVSANHVSSVKIGESVVATARILRQGTTIHNWFVEVRTEQGDLVSAIQVTNFIKREQNPNV